MPKVLMELDHDLLLRKMCSKPIPHWQVILLFRSPLMPSRVCCVLMSDGPFASIFRLGGSHESVSLHQLLEQWRVLGSRCNCYLALRSPEKIQPLDADNPKYPIFGFLEPGGYSFQCVVDGIWNYSIQFVDGQNAAEDKLIVGGNFLPHYHLRGQWVQCMGFRKYIIGLWTGMNQLLRYPGKDQVIIKLGNFKDRNLVRERKTIVIVVLFSMEWPLSYHVHLNAPYTTDISLWVKNTWLRLTKQMGYLFSLNVAHERYVHMSCNTIFTLQEAMVALTDSREERSAFRASEKPISFLRVPWWWVSGPGSWPLFESRLSRSITWSVDMVDP